MTAQAQTLPLTPPGAATHLFARLVVAATLPLILFGGSVTSLDAGMAVEGWLTVQSSQGERLLWLYPLEDWFRNIGQFVEHSHRMVGTVVGLFAIGAVLAAFVEGASAAARRATTIALIAVCIQGTIGGFRVLENSENLAFLHGALGQAVFGVIVAAAVISSPRWLNAEPKLLAQATSLRRTANNAVTSVYMMIVAGAWLRHTDEPVALAVHLMVLLYTAASVFGLVHKLKSLETGSQGDWLHVCAKRLTILFAAQVALGIFAFAAVFIWYGPTATGVHDSVLPTLHVLGGALLLGQCVASRLWVGKLLRQGDAA
jgi:cytochrome c oxidase assembly protein subunit 15